MCIKNLELIFVYVIWYNIQVVENVVSVLQVRSPCLDSRPPPPSFKTVVLLEIFSYYNNLIPLKFRYDDWFDLMLIHSLADGPFCCNTDVCTWSCVGSSPPLSCKINKKK